MSNQTTDEQISSQAEEKKEEKKKSPLVIVIISAIVVIAVLVGVIIYLLNRPDATGKPEVDMSNVVTPDNVEEVVQQMEEEEKVPVGSYEVSMNTEWVFPDGNSASSNAFVENSTANTNTVYFVVTLDGSKEEIYRSPYLMVGSHIENFKLDTALEKGTYNAIITYHLVDDDYNDLRSVSMYMTITVEN